MGYERERLQWDYAVNLLKFQMLKESPIFMVMMSRILIAKCRDNTLLTICLRPNLIHAMRRLYVDPISCLVILYTVF